LNDAVNPTRDRALGWIAICCLVVFVASWATIVIGDPLWNLWFIFFAWFVAAPVGVVTVVLWLMSRRRSQTA
jgi:hypothetical protein